MSYAAPFDRPLFPPALRWSARVLAWLAFAVAAYLAWHSVNQTHVAGCGVGNANGCDVVQSSAWSRWLGVPVAVLGLGCYASLAALSVLLGLSDPRVRRWIEVAFVTLAITAGIASLWFIAIQVVAIGHFCVWCLFTDFAGIALACLALLSLLSDTGSVSRPAPIAASRSAGLSALRSAIPAQRIAPVATQAQPAQTDATSSVPRQSSPTLVPRPTMPLAVSRPSAPLSPNALMAIACGVASVLVALLAGGQLLFPSKTYEVAQLAIKDTIDLNAAEEKKDDAAPSLDAETRVAMRVPTDSTDNDENSTGEEQTETENGNGDEKSSAAPISNDGSANGSTNSAAYESERLIKFLGGKLTLDAHKHPLIGSPNAKHIIVELVSYDCPHCRKTHRTVKQALRRYGDQVAIIVVPIPLESGCNPLVTNPAASHPGACAAARMAIGVAKLKPASFQKFHDWLMAGGEKPPALDRIIAKAYSLVDRTKLRDLSRGEELNKQVQQYVNLFAALQKQHTGNKEFGLPVQILGDKVVFGTVEKVDDMAKTWEENLGVKPE